MIVQIRIVAILSASMFAFAPWGSAQTPAGSAAATVWNALSAAAMDPAKSAHAENVDVIRDHVHINLTDGTIQFTQPVNGVVFGAVFHGKGRLQADPPNPQEAQQLRLFTKQDRLNVEFGDATFSFTDGLLDEIGKQVKWQTSGPAADDLYAKRQKEREDLGESSMPRLLQSILSADRVRTAYFLADVRIDKGWVEVHDDALNPEDISVGRWVDVGPFKIFDTWMSFPAGRTSAAAWKDPKAKEDFTIRSYKIDVGATSGADLNATAHLDLEPRLAGQSVLIFDLDANLRLESVKDSRNNSLAFYQSRETKDRYQSYGDYVAVILAQPLVVGTPLSLDFRYGGKRAIRKAGNGNYFCESSGWYPERPNSFSARADFDLTFHSPKNSALVATGEKTSETVDGGTRITTWKSEIPLAVAGFAYGDYKVTNDKAGDVAIDIYANRSPDDVMTMVQRYFEEGPGKQEAAVGSMSPSIMAKTMGTEIANAVRVYSAWYGPFPYKHLSVTSLPISYSYGQGWPGLIYLWSASFLDSTQRNAIGLKDQTGLTDFFRGHETSHQWWGHRVGWKSYHDQWLSEGFAEFSGNLYVQYRQNMKEYLLRWRKEKEMLRKSDVKGHKVEELGPIWMGQRIASSITDGSSYQDLIYSKGGYILQMLRMQLMNPRDPDPDHLFKEMMQDYCKTFDNKAASTEDFKAIVEKHMTHGMDLDGNHKMDWFFNQYVYGIGEAQYTFHSTAEATADGKTHIKGEITRTGVPDTWKDAVPLYAHIGDKTVKMGLMSVVHASEPFDFAIPGKIDRVSINDFEDLLAEVKQ
ncbi:MAG TPA: M1 family aminopeptidase [Candidatus Binatus sp.]|nr:M1 family aminopeptidase [Candidatus Binatus sp.]